jgi:hypothetical protein
MTPPADRFAKWVVHPCAVVIRLKRETYQCWLDPAILALFFRYAYPPSYEQIKEREEKLSKKEAEKAAAKAAKGMPFPPGGYLAMGNQ